MQDFARLTDHKTDDEPATGNVTGNAAVSSADKHTCSVTGRAWDLGAYHRCNHISNNTIFKLLFQEYVAHFQMTSITLAALKNYFDSRSETKPLQLLWCEGRHVMIAAYSQHDSQVQINPAISVLDQAHSHARLCALTVVFDQVIYAQLHWQSLAPQREGPLAGKQKLTLPQLLRIKLSKQHAAEHNQFFREAEPLTIFDPYCAWHLACPSYVSTPGTAWAEFNRMQQSQE